MTAEPTKEAVVSALISMDACPFCNLSLSAHPLVRVDGPLRAFDILSCEKCPPDGWAIGQGP